MFSHGAVVVAPLPLSPHDFIPITHGQGISLCECENDVKCWWTISNVQVNQGGHFHPKAMT